MAELLVQIDMVNGFTKEGALHDVKILEIVSDIAKLHDEFIKKNQPRLIITEWHDVDDKEFEEYPPHCIKNTYESETIDELKKYEKGATIIRKNTTNGMNTKKAREYFKNNTFKKITVVGCCTDICVLQFVLSLIKYLKELGKNTEIIIPENGVATFDAPNHDAKTFHNNALKIMEENGATVYYEQSSSYQEGSDLSSIRR